MPEYRNINFHGRLIYPSYRKWDVNFKNIGTATFKPLGTHQERQQDIWKVIYRMFFSVWPISADQMIWWVLLHFMKVITTVIVSLAPAMDC
jgi:hypothetical protein